MELVAFIVLGVGFMSFVFLVSSLGSSRQRRLLTEIADELGGEVIDKRTLFFRSSSLVVERGETIVRVDEERGLRGGGSRRKEDSSVTPYTCVRSVFVVPDGPRFRVFPERSLAAVSKALGARDLMIDDDGEFDACFVVKGRDEERVRAAWSSRAREIMVERFPRGTVTSDGDVVELLVKGRLSKEEIIQAIELAAELVSVDFFGLEALESLPGARYLPPEGPWGDRTLPVAEIDDVIPLFVGPVLTDRGAVTTVETRHALEAWGTLHVDIEEDGSLHGAKPKDLPESARGLLRRIGRARLDVAEGEASLVWYGIVTDLPVLQAGVEVITSFGVPPRVGAYR